MGGGRARGTICWGGECGRDGFCEGCAELCARLAGPSVAGDAIAVGSYGNADRLGRGAQCCPMQSVELRCCREEEELFVAHSGAISHAGSLWHMRLFGGTTRWRFRWRRHGGQDCSARRVLEAASVVQRSRPSSQRPPRQRAAPAAVGARRAAMHIAAGSSPLLCCSQFRSCRALIGAVAVRGPSTHSFRMLTSRFNLQHAMRCAQTKLIGSRAGCGCRAHNYLALTRPNPAVLQTPLLRLFCCCAASRKSTPLDQYVYLCTARTARTLDPPAHHYGEPVEKPAQLRVSHPHTRPGAIHPHSTPPTRQQIFLPISRLF